MVFDSHASKAPNLVHTKYEVSWLRRIGEEVWGSSKRIIMEEWGDPSREQLFLDPIPVFVFSCEEHYASYVN